MTSSAAEPTKQDNFYPLTILRWISDRRCKFVYVFLYTNGSKRFHGFHCRVKIAKKQTDGSCWGWHTYFSLPRWYTTLFRSMLPLWFANFQVVLPNIASLNSIETISESDAKGAYSYSGALVALNITMENICIIFSSARFRSAMYFSSIDYAFVHWHKYCEVFFSPIVSLFDLTAIGKLPCG